MPLLGTIGRGRRTLTAGATTLVKNLAAVTAAAASAEDGELFYSTDDGFTYVSLGGDAVLVAGTSLLLASYSDPAAVGVSIPANTFSPLGVTGGLAPTLSLALRRPPGSPDLGYTAGLGVFGAAAGRLLKFGFSTTILISGPAVVTYVLRGRPTPIDPWTDVALVCGHDRTQINTRYCGQGTIYVESNLNQEFQLGLVHDGGAGPGNRTITMPAARIWLEIAGLAS